VGHTSSDLSKVGRVTVRCDIQKVNTAADQIVKIGEIIDGYAAGVDI